MSHNEYSDERGVLYIATGDEFVKGAKRSAESLSRHNDLSITLVSDKLYDYNVFDNVLTIDEPRFDKGDSIPQFEHLLYEKTLLLDTDTYICDNIEEMFDTLDQFDLGCALNVGFPIEYSDLETDQNLELPKIPTAFYEYNTGVVLLKHNERVRKFLERWQTLYDNQTELTRNQPAFRQALYDDEVRFFPLPRKYNYRLPKLGFVNGHVKIIHGNHPVSYEKIERCINSTEERRVITKTGWPMGTIRAHDLSLKFKIYYNLGRNGITGSIKKLFRKVF